MRQENRGPMKLELTLPGKKGADHSQELNRTLQPEGIEILGPVPDSLNEVLTIMDDGIVTKIQEAGNEPDEERQAERNQALVKYAEKLLATLRAHRLAEVTDNNPFGSFAIRGPLESVLVKISSDFNN